MRLARASTLAEKVRTLAAELSRCPLFVSATVIVFDPQNPARDVRSGSDFAFRDNSLEVRRLFVHALQRKGESGALFYAKHDARKLASFGHVPGEIDHLFIPLQTQDEAIGLVAFALHQKPEPELLRHLRTLTDIAAVLLDAARENSAGEREIAQRALLDHISDRIRKTLDRKELLTSVAEEVRAAFGAARCVMYERDSENSLGANVLAVAQDGSIPVAVPGALSLSASHLKRVFSGAAVRGDADMLVPFYRAGRVENAMALHFAAPHAFSDAELSTLRSIAAQVGLALANVELYESENQRRKRAELLERVLRTLTDTQYIDEVLQILVVTVSHELNIGCAAYAIAGNRLIRQAARAVDAQGRLPEQEIETDLAAVMPDDTAVIDAALLPGPLRAALFPAGAGLAVMLRLDGDPWGLLVFQGPDGTGNTDAREFYRSLGVHAELALANARAFEQQRRLAQERSILAEAARSIMSFQELRALVDAMSRLAGSLAGAQSACVLRWTQDSYRVVGSSGADAQEMLSRIGLDVQERIIVPDGEGPELTRRQRAVGEKGNPQTALFALNTNLTESGSRYVLGMLVAARAFDAPAFSSNEKRLLQELSALLALAMRNLELYERTTSANRALTESSTFKDDLLAMFAHDFKGPLTVILGYCELLFETAPEFSEEIETIFSQANRLVRLSEDAVVLAQTQAGGFSLAREIVDLGPFVEQTLAIHNRATSRIRIVIPGERVPVSLDPTRFRHVLDNLVLNALKYSEQAVDVTVKRSGERVYVEIADHGIGIPESELTNVFTRFGRATNARRKGIAGSGIGLYVSYQIVEVHGGTIMVSSKENAGSTFTIVLPVATEVAAPAR